MAEIGTRAPRFSLRDITSYQWLVLFVAWAGWSLDITDFTLYGLVLRQALTELLGGSPTMAQIGSVGGLLTTIGLLGWAFGGFFFGIVADYRPSAAISDRALPRLKCSRKLRCCLI